MNGLGGDHPAVIRSVVAAPGVEGSKSVCPYGEKRDDTHTCVHGATVYVGLVRDALVSEDLIPEGRSRGP